MISIQNIKVYQFQLNVPHDSQLVLDTVAIHLNCNSNMLMVTCKINFNTVKLISNYIYFEQLNKTEMTRFDLQVNFKIMVLIKFKCSFLESNSFL